MFLLIICGVLLWNTADVTCYDSDYKAIPGGWIKAHKLYATWAEAVEQCNKEGAILASPINEDLLYHMKSIISANGHTTAYFIGTNANLKSGLYISLEGVPVSNMPMYNETEYLNPKKGLCMSMDHKDLYVENCKSTWPYMCYKARDDRLNMTECGTFDKKYIRLSGTGSCYKFHPEKVNWTTAYETCINEGAYLAILNDNNEQSTVRDFIWEQNNPDDNYVHIGMLEWTVGGPWFSVHWEPIEINGSKHSQLRSHVTEHFQHGGHLLKTGELTLNSLNSSVNQFICEKDPAYIRFTPISSSLPSTKW